jgi:hypothetical protein
MYWPDEGNNEISYQQQPAPKHQYKTYRDDSESDGGSTESKSSTKINKPKTQVHRTQFIFGLKSQKAAAERRRFDVNKFIEKSHGSNHSSLEREVHEHTCSNSSLSIRHILDQENDSSLVSPNGYDEEDQPCAESVYDSIYDEHGDSSSGYSQNSRSTVGELPHNTYREEEESRRYDSELIERYTSSDDLSYCNSTPHSKNNYDDDMYIQSKGSGSRSCCGQARWSIVAFATAFLIMTIAGTGALFSDVFGSDLIPSSGVGKNAKNITYAPSIAPTSRYSRQPSHGPIKVSSNTPSNAPSPQPSYWPTGGPSRSPSHAPSNAPYGYNGGGYGYNDDYYNYYN